MATINDYDGNVYYKNDSIAQTNTTIPQKEDIITPDFMNSMISAITFLEGTVDKIDNCGYSIVCCQAMCIINECIPRPVDCNICIQCNEGTAEEPDEESSDDTSSDEDDS